MAPHDALSLHGNYSVLGGSKLRSQSHPDVSTTTSKLFTCRYLDSFDELLRLMASLHLLSPFPDIIILDSITDFMPQYALQHEALPSCAVPAGC